jgi:hypothetical protein
LRLEAGGKREEFLLFGYLFPVIQAGKRGQGRFSEEYVRSNMDSLVERLAPNLVWFMVSLEVKC